MFAELRLPTIDAVVPDRPVFLYQGGGGPARSNTLGINHANRALYHLRIRWLPRADGLPVGPLYPQILASGVPAGMHEDGVHIAPHNPWFAMHYATTGLNVLGQQINPGQQITRQQALYAYTRGNAWYLNRENDLGSIEVGKLGDLVVLDRDYFSVSDADMRRTRAIMAVVGGRIVYDAGV